MCKPTKLWYSFLGGKSDENQVGFYATEDFKWVEILEKNWMIIAGEIEQYLLHNEDKIKPYFNKSLVTKKKKWKTSGFLFWNWKIKKNIKQCPETIKILNQIPNLISASVSILESDVMIKEHRGDTNAIIRGHLALKVPVKLPECGFRVNDNEKSWEEGKVLLFNDASLHSSWNNSKKRRYVLLFDVIRPEYVSKKYKICSLVLSSLLLQGFIQKILGNKKLPFPIYITFLYINSWCINILLRFQHVFYNS